VKKVPPADDTDSVARHCGVIIVRLCEVCVNSHNLNARWDIAM